MAHFTYQGVFLDLGLVGRGGGSKDTPFLLQNITFSHWVDDPLPFFSTQL